MAPSMTAEKLIVFRGCEVLDITNFAATHPGGRSILEKYAGKDITSAFESTGHSSAARRLADTFVVSAGHSETIAFENPDYDSDEQGAAEYHSRRRAEMLRRHPEIEQLYGTDWLPLLYGPFCMAGFGAHLSFAATRTHTASIPYSFTIP
jgi:hypothetical protein